MINCSLLTNAMPHMILQTQPKTIIAVAIWSIAAIKHIRKALSHLSLPYSVVQPNSIAIEAKNVPAING